jgi:hypothetical protein
MSYITPRQFAEATVSALLKTSDEKALWDRVELTLKELQLDTFDYLSALQSHINEYYRLQELASETRITIADDHLGFSEDGVRAEVDPSVIGGFKVQGGDTLIDHTYSSKLQQLSKKLLSN